MTKHVTHTGDPRFLKDVEAVRRLLKQLKDGKVERHGRKLVPSEKNVLMQLADDHNEERGCAWPSVPNLAMRIGVTERQCQRLIRALERDKMIESRPRLRDKDSGRTSNEYRFWFDPPFDLASTRATEKKMRHQAMLNSQRPVQMRFAPPDTHVTGVVTPKPPPPRHQRHHPPDTHVTGVVTSMSGGKELPKDLLGELALDLATELPEENLPAQSAEGLLDVDQQRWQALKLELKTAIISVSPKLAAAKQWETVKPSPEREQRSWPATDDDFAVCFDWWFLEAVKRQDDCVLLITTSADDKATAEGLHKYSNRLQTLALKFFGDGRQRPIHFRLVKSS